MQPQSGDEEVEEYDTTGPVVEVEVYGRDEFIAERWRYNSGEHVTILGPTGCGKTTLAYQLLKETSTPALPGVVLVMKPRDSTVDTWTPAAKFRKVRSWPPGPTLFGPRKPRGWVLWPRHTYDPAVDDYNLHRQFRKAMIDSYKKGDRIVFGDEAYGLSNELHLDRTLVTLWTRGRSMGCALWVASQKPTHIPLHAYNQAEHLFLFNDPDKRARDRFGEIGGVDPDLLKLIVVGLKKHQALYIRRDGPVLCIVDG